MRWHDYFETAIVAIIAIVVAKLILNAIGQSQIAQQYL
jgi:hypothetical protein